MPFHPFYPEVFKTMQIELQDVSKTFGKVKALADFNLSIPPSSVIALLGENGAGKSTLLRILSGMSVPDQGIVRYDGQIYDRENIALRKRLHFTPDMPLLLPDLSVSRNLAIFAESYGKPTTGREDYITHWLNETGVASLINRTAGLLSRGQSWKVGLASVALIAPDLWLADEPFASGMDEIGLASFRSLATHLAEQGGTVIYTTQMVPLAAEFSDQICVIRDGRMILHTQSEKLRSFLQNNPGKAADILRGKLDEA